MRLYVIGGLFLTHVPQEEASVVTHWREGMLIEVVPAYILHHLGVRIVDLSRLQGVWELIRGIHVP